MSDRSAMATGAAPVGASMAAGDEPVNAPLDAASLRQRLAGRLVVLVGGGGFVGRHVAEALLAAGARVRVAQRSPRTAAGIRPLGDLGQTQFVHADVGDAATIARAVAGADAVVNLVGVLAGDFMGIHVAGARRVAEAAAAAKVATLVQVSAIGADAESASAYGRSKALGEAAMLDAFPAAVIVRPSIVFGRDDQFINRFASMIRMAPVVPVVAGTTKFQPVFVGDVADAIAAIIADPAPYQGETLALGGPEVVSMDALMRRIAVMIGKRQRFIAVPSPVSSMIARAGDWLPGAPITSDQWKMLQSDNVVGDQADGLALLGIAPRPLAAVADGWLTRYRRHGRFTLD